MRTRKDSLDPLIAHLRVIKDMGLLEPGQWETSQKTFRRLQHAVRVGDIRAIRKALDDLARLFTRAGARTRSNESDES